jgi:hypothetical protein
MPTPTSLDDVLYELALTSTCPNADVINDFVRRYPEHSHEIVEFAAELALAANREEQDETEHSATETSAAVAKALRVFEDLLDGQPRRS